MVSNKKKKKVFSFEQEHKSYIFRGQQSHQIYLRIKSYVYESRETEAITKPWS